jgi:hypothetical protein
MPQPFSKEQPLSIRDPLVTPPWQAMVKAGPNASKDIDLETLNGPLPQSTLAAQQTADVPPVAEPEPEQKAEVPDNRVAITSVAVLAVLGDANSELTKAMRDVLSGAGWKVKSAPAKDALTIRGTVQIGKPQGATQQVKLSWIVASPDGKALGTINQANNVPAGSLARGWGDNARPAAEAAATGIFDLINKFR